MATKKSAKTTAAPAKKKSATKRPTRLSLPPLSVQPDYKAAAANDAEPAPVKGKQAKVTASEPSETLGPKLRSKSEILSALHKGARVLHTESGLYRIGAADGTQNPASKRRILSLTKQAILVPIKGDNRTYVLDLEAEKKASEKKPKKSEPGK